MAMPTKTFNEFVQDQIIYWSGQLGVIPQLSPGDALLAAFESVSTQMEFLQGLASLVLKLARAQTSTGDDLDTWMAQFSFNRLTAVQATGQVVLSRNSVAPNAIQVPVGSIVQTTGGAIQYEVVENTALPAWDVSQGLYVMNAGQSSITVEVRAFTAGTIGNVSANQIVQIGSTLPGIDTVTNPSPFSNGVNQESDDDYRARFVLYLSTLAKATENAILAAAHSVQQGLHITALENINPSGEEQLGCFTLVVDDGSGSPPQDLIDRIYNAVYAVRAFSVRPYVIQPTAMTGTVSITIRLDPNALDTIVIPAVQNAIVTYIQSVDVGGIVYVSRIEDAAIHIDGVVAIQPGTTAINGEVEDLQLARTDRFAVTVSDVGVGTY